MFYQLNQLHRPQQHCAFTVFASLKATLSQKLMAYLQTVFAASSLCVIFGCSRTAIEAESRRYACSLS